MPRAGYREKRQKRRNGLAFLPGSSRLMRRPQNRHSEMSCTRYFASRSRGAATYASAREASRTLRVDASTDRVASAMSFMLELMSVTRRAATCMLDEMLGVTEACSSTDAAIAAEISLRR